MDRKMYDTVEGIASQLTTFEDFNALIIARRAAGYERNERLGEFYIFGGRFSTDTFGNFSKAWPDIFPAELYPLIPPVLTKEEYQKWCVQHAKRESLVINGTHILPETMPNSKIVDPITGVGWTIADCHEAIAEATHEEIDLTAFVGKTLREVKQALEERADGLYTLRPNGVRNASCIDMTEEFFEPVNLEGWRREEEITDNYIIQPGDRVEVDVVRFYHADSHKEYLAKQQLEETTETAFAFKEWLTETGFTGVSLAITKVPQGLIDQFPEEAEDEETKEIFSQLPYYQVTTDQGTFGLLTGGEDVPWLYSADSGITTQELQRELNPLEPVDEEHPKYFFALLSPCILELFLKVLIRKQRSS